MTTTSNKVAAAAHFALWTEMAQGMTATELAYATRDALDSAKACAGWDAGSESFYRDQAMTFDQEMASR